MTITQANEIREFILTYFRNIEEEEYIGQMDLDEVNGTYMISLAQGNPDRPVKMFIEADTMEELYKKIESELRSRVLPRVRYGTLYKYK